MKKIMIYLCLLLISCSIFVTADANIGGTTKVVDLNASGTINAVDMWLTDTFYSLQDGVDAIKVRSSDANYSQFSMGIISGFDGYSYFQSTALGNGTILPISFWIGSGLSAKRMVDINATGLYVNGTIYENGTSLDSRFEPMLPTTPTEPTTKFLDGNRQWNVIPIGGGGYSANVYLSNLSSTTNNTYWQLSYTNPISSYSDSVSATNNETLAHIFIFDTASGISTIDAGSWRINTYCAIDSQVGDSKLKFVGFAYSNTGTERVLFTTYSNNIENRIGTEGYMNIITETIQPVINLNTTDKLGVRIYFNTSSNPERTLTCKIGGDTASYLNTPIRIRHMQLLGLNDDINYLHYSNTGNITTTGNVSAKMFFEDGLSIANKYSNIARVTALETLNNYTNEPTGFEAYAYLYSTLAFNPTSRNLSITAITGNYTYMVNGTVCSKASDSIIISNTTGLHYVYYNNCDGLVDSASSWVFKGMAQVATVYYDATGQKAIVGRERHGWVMDWKTHEYEHLTEGLRWESGLAGTFNNTAFSIGTGRYWDEDNDFTISSTLNNCDVMYRNGSIWNWTKNATQYYFKNATNMYYDNSGVLTPVTSTGGGSYMAIWVFATNNLDTPLSCILGQREDSSLTNARNNNIPSSLSFGTLPYPEYKLLYRVIIRNTATPYIETADYRTVSNSPNSNYVATSHSTLTGLTNDDHPQYLLTDGSRDITGDMKFTGGSNINASITDLLSSNTSTNARIDTLNSTKLNIAGGTMTGNISTNSAIQFTVNQTVMVFANGCSQIANSTGVYFVC